MSNQSEARSTGPNIPVVAAVLKNGMQVIINWGEKVGIRTGQSFLVYGPGPEISDPVTGRSLGHLEIVRGRGVIVHVQDRMATLQSTETRPGERRRAGGLSGLGGTVVEGPPIDAPFDGVKVGDHAKPI